jgi:hypothetical protein
MTPVAQIAFPWCVAAGVGGRNRTGATKRGTSVRGKAAGLAAGLIDAEARPAAASIRGGSA